MNSAVAPIVIELTTGRPSGADTLAVQVLLLAAAFAALLFFLRSRRIGECRARDARLVAELRSAIHAGKFPEARERARVADGALAGVLLGVLRFPEGAHRDGIDRALSDGLASSAPGASRIDMLFPAAAALTALVLVPALAGWPVRFDARDVIALQAFASMAVILGIWWRLEARVRDETRRVAHDAVALASTLAERAEQPIDPGTSHPEEREAARAVETISAAVAETIGEAR